MIEDELKLSVSGPFSLPDLTTQGIPGLADVRAAGVRTLRATYWDTSDLRLARNGLTLRYRTGEDVPPWQLKIPVPSRGRGVREELGEPGQPDQPPGPLRALVTGWVRTAVLAPVATLRTERATFELLDSAGDELAELVDDRVSVLAGRTVSREFREIEIERRGADDATLNRLRDALVGAGAVEGEFLPKVVQALGPLATAPSDLPAVPAVTADGPAGDVVGYALAASVRRLVAHHGPVRRDAPDAVHQMRVACRRLRSDLRTFAPLVEADWADGLRAELAWLAGVLGAARDLEVLRERIAAATGDDPQAPLDDSAVRDIDAILAERQLAAVADVEAALAEPRYALLLERVVEAARHPALPAAAQEPAATALPPLVGTAWRKLARRARLLAPDGPDADWHQVRIRAKRARYAAEASTPALGAPAGRLGAAAESIQDLLGQHQDCVVAAETLLDIAGQARGDTVLAVTCGRLAERERAAAREVRTGFPAVWAAARRPKNTSWLAPA